METTLSNTILVICVYEIVTRITDMILITIVVKVIKTIVIILKIVLIKILKIIITIMIIITTSSWPWNTGITSGGV